MKPRFSIIVPVYNRPDEVQELLDSLCLQRTTNFEVLIIEDGSSIRCDQVVDQFRNKLTLHYFFKPNSGPGPTRNFGFAQAKGDYFVVFDSDCIIPPDYFTEVEEALKMHEYDSWGGPDAPHQSFSNRQRAMGYTMSSFLTTGGIRGGKKHVGWFQPRSFNMGISRSVYEKTGGFQFDRYAEDIEFSIRMKELGFKVGLINEAFVFHKRRSTFKAFYRQVSNFGKGRALVGKKYPDEVKVTHWFPSLFTLGLLISVILGVTRLPFGYFAVASYLLYFCLLFVHALIINKSLIVAILSVPAAFLQLTGYGIGFLRERLSG